MNIMFTSDDFYYNNDTGTISVKLSTELETELVNRAKNELSSLNANFVEDINAETNINVYFDANTEPCLQISALGYINLYTAFGGIFSSDENKSLITALTEYVNTKLDISQIDTNTGDVYVNRYKKSTLNFVNKVKK